MLENPQTYTLCIWIAQNTIRQYDCHFATRLQEVVTCLNKKDFWSLAAQFISRSNLLIYFYFRTKRRVRKHHIKLALCVCCRSFKMEITVGTVTDTFIYSLSNMRNIRFATIRIIQRVDVIDIWMSVTGHHHIHTCSLLQVRVEIETEYHLLGILSNGIIHFSRVQFGFKVHLVQFRIEITGYLVAHMVEYHH